MQILYIFYLLDHHFARFLGDTLFISVKMLKKWKGHNRSKSALGSLDQFLKNQF